MRGILADVNIDKHFRMLIGLLESESRIELWSALNLDVLTFADLMLAPAISDRQLWVRCQKENLVLITVNRNHDGPDSLEPTIRDLNSPESLPVFTIGSGDRFQYEPAYRARCADRFLELLYEIENLQGTGRLYLP